MIGLLGIIAVALVQTWRERRRPARGPWGNLPKGIEDIREFAPLPDDDAPPMISEPWRGQHRDEVQRAYERTFEKEMCRALTTAIAFEEQRARIDEVMSPEWKP